MGYTGEEEVQHRNSEHFTTHPDGSQQKRMTDSHFIVVGKMRRNYVVECVTNPDGSVVLQIFEYGLQVMLASATVEGNVLSATFPHIGLVSCGAERARGMRW